MIELTSGIVNTEDLNRIKSEAAKECYCKAENDNEDLCLPCACRDVLNGMISLKEKLS